MLNTFSYLDNIKFGSQISFLFSEVTIEEIKELMDFGFDININEGRVVLSNNKNACAKLLLEDIYFDDFIQDVLEYRFFGEESAISEIVNVYIKDNLTFSEIKEDLLSDWHLTDNEKLQIKKNKYAIQSNYYF